MKSISIYAVTRNQNIGQLQKLEHQNYPSARLDQFVFLCQA